MTPPLACTVVLAAGLGTRMKSRTPKVLHPVCGLSLIEHVLRAAAAVSGAKTVVVLGHGHEQVRPLLPPEARVALQREQKGTGHAVLAAAEQLLGAGEKVSGKAEVTGGPRDEGTGPRNEGTGAYDRGKCALPAESQVMLVLPGDTPLVTGEVLMSLVEGHFATGVEATVLTMELDDPTGYGRVIRSEDGLVERIVEHRDAAPEERVVREVNSGMYVLPVRRTVEILAGLGTDNAQGELYLTDVLGSLRSEGARVGAVRAPDARRLLGVNTRVELAEASSIMRAEICRHWMLAGVTIDDPGSTYVEAGVTLEADVRLRPFTVLEGNTVVERDCVLGPFVTVRDGFVGAGSHVYNSFVEGMRLAPGTDLGPFACVRAGE